MFYVVIVKRVKLLRRRNENAQINYVTIISIFYTIIIRFICYMRIEQAIIQKASRVTRSHERKVERNARNEIQA